jgi:type IV pilus assembly protein PilY1
MNAAFTQTQCATRYAKRLLAWSLASCLIGAPAFAAQTDISSTPLASGGQTASPNLLFTLDDSGSMAWTYLPDYVNDGNTCMTQNGGTIGTGPACSAGDPPFDAGGAQGFNGVAYDPNLYYASGVDSTGKPYINPPSGTLTVTSVTDNAYVGGTNRDLTTYITDKTYCNANGVCKRNGADSTGAVVSGTDGQGHALATGQFPYRTNPSNSSTAIFGLPEMMSIGSFGRSGTTVSVSTVEAHGLTTSDRVYVFGTNSVDVNCVAVTGTTANSFTYTTGASGTVSGTTGSYRKCVQASFSLSGGTVTVTSTAHGLVTGDLITVVTSDTNLNRPTATVTVTNVNTFTYTTSSTATTSGSGYWVRGAGFTGTGSFSRSGGTVTVTSTAHGLATGDVISVNTGNNRLDTSGASVTVVDANTFTYSMSGSRNISATSGTWITGNGLYNSVSTVSGVPHSYWITPVEYCTDASLTDCVEVLPGAAQPAGYTEPAYVRFCQTQAQALATGGVGDSSGTPRCRSKYVKGLSGVPNYIYPRYGWFNRDTITSTVTSYGNRPNRGDCANAPTCTYDEEMQNYARWFAYYQTRMQMMKSAVGRAFLPFISNPPTKPNMIRVGFITINPTTENKKNGSDLGTVQSAKYLKISDFNAAQASSLYTKFYGIYPDPGTPLREALSRAGWIFAGKLNVNNGLTDGIPAADDPMQVSCQRNYTLLTTDGYWNAGQGDGQHINATTMGNWDAVDKEIISPYSSYMVDRTTTGTLDGVGASSSSSQPQTITQQMVCMANNTTAFGQDPTTHITTETTCGCASGEHRIKQRTISGDSINGATPTNWAASFQDFTACLPVYVTTTTTPVTRKEQVACTGNNSVSFAGGTVTTTCGCATGYSKVLEADSALTNTLVTTDGTQTQNTTTSPTSGNTTFQDALGCAAYTTTTTTPVTRKEQVICTGTGTASFAGGAVTQACGCTAGQNKIVQATSSLTNTVVVTGGVTTSNTTTSPVSGNTTFQTIQACANVVQTTTTPITRKEQALCSGNNTVSFASGAVSTACGCSTNFKKILEADSSLTNTVTVTNGTQTGNTTTAVSSGNTAYSTPVACNATVVTATTTATQVTQSLNCIGNTGSAHTVTFANGTSQSCSCGSGGSTTRHVLIRQVLTGATHTVVTADGTQTSNTITGGSAAYTYSIDGTNWTSTAPTGSGCAAGSTSLSGAGPTYSGGTTTTATSGSTITASNITLSPNPTTVNGTSSTTSNAFTSANYTISPNPSSVNGTPSSTSTAYTSANATLSPNPTTVNGTASSTSTGTPATITLSPNPNGPINGAMTSVFVPGGTSNTLADVAMYYYQTDLRGGFDNQQPTPKGTGPSTSPSSSPSGGDVATNNLLAKSGAKDFVTAQHMVTFTIGMADGLMHYQADYDTATNGDFYNIKIGAQDKCFWASGPCNWPAPVGDTQSALDDLWHAAVNGRGQFYQALNANALDQGLQGSLSAMGMQVAAAAASATSSPNVTQTNNSLFSTTFETNTWSGKVFAQTIDAATGGISSVHLWDADTLLLNQVTASTDTRNLYTFDSSSTSKLKPFLWANLDATEQTYFADKCVPLTTMGQCAGLSAAQLIDANIGENLVNFLRGQTGFEATVYRDRNFIDPATNNVYQTVLGDTMDAKPIFVGAPTFSYSDAGYSAFASSNASRTALVYVGANDGYLHAFNAATGVEAWAYTPRFLMPGLYQLADSAYGSKHVFFVDGSPSVGDVFDGTASAWKTILVGGVNGGGKGYYALDVTDPANPKGLWEFCADSTICARNDVDLGFSFGNPLIGKRSSDGKWVVVLTSGLNNTSGVGYFYVLDAITGAIIEKVATTIGGVSVGTPTTPSGLMKASAYRDSPSTDGSFKYIYAGDQLGNVWRLDYTAGTPVVTHMAYLRDVTGRAQPITTRPELTLIGSDRVLYIGTGRYLGGSDLSDPGAASGIAWQQTLYAFKDKNADYGVLRSDSKMVAQYLTDNGGTRTVTSNAVDWTAKDGWYVDFNPGNTSPGERVNIDPQLVLGTLVVVTNIPTVGSSCSVGGSSMKYDFNYSSGSAISGQTSVGFSLGGSIAVGMAVVQLPSGEIKDIVTLADTSKLPTAVSTTSSSSVVKRFSYRER